MLTINNLEVKKMVLYDSYVESKNYKEFIDKVNNIFDNPFFIFDPALKLVATSFDNIKKGKYLRVKKEDMILSLKEIEEDNEIIIKEMLKEDNDDPSIKCIEGVKHPLFYKKLKDGKYELGYFCLYSSNRPFNDDDKILIDELCKIVVHYFKIKGFDKTIRQMVFIKILDGEYVSKEGLDHILKNLNIDIKTNNRLLITKTDNPNEVSSYLVAKYRNAYTFVYNESVVSILYDDYDMNNVPIIKQETGEDNLVFGMSEEFHDYSDLIKYYRQALEAINLGEKYAPNNVVHYYDKYRLLSLTSKASKQELIDILDKRVLEVIDYDKKYKYEYLSDLNVFFESGRNINKAAQMLFIHKNSMYYRLEKIKEVFNIDLDDPNDCFNIELSIRLLKFIENK